MLPQKSSKPSLLLNFSYFSSNFPTSLSSSIPLLLITLSCLAQIPNISCGTMTIIPASLNIVRNVIPIPTKSSTPRPLQPSSFQPSQFSPQPPPPQLTSNEITMPSGVPPLFPTTNIRNNLPSIPSISNMRNNLPSIPSISNMRNNLPNILPNIQSNIQSNIQENSLNPNETTIISTSMTIHDTNNNANKSNWWILGTRRNYAKYLDITPMSYKINCKKVKFLNEIQQEICAEHHNIINAIGRGARMGIDECQHQFKMNRWNCSTYEQEGARVFGSVLDINSREKAFIHAISTAGVVYSITRACSKGEMAQCGCDEKIRSKDIQGKWEWGGCSDDIHYGADFTKKFIDSVEDPTQPEGLVNLHNNEVGRRVIKSKMELICKCHGMSGSCTIKVCWRKMKPFREVGQDLSSRFDGATHVKVIESRKKRSRLRPAQKNVKKPSKRDLVYLEESPDFCFKNLTVGAEGTKDRICNATSYGLEGCRYLCCGRGYRTIEREIEAKCNCKFVWCCNVKCDKCRSKIIEHRCN